MKWLKPKNTCGVLVREDGKYIIETEWRTPYHFKVMDETGKVIEIFYKQKRRKNKI